MVSLLCPRRCCGRGEEGRGEHTVQCGYGTRPEPQALGEAQVLLDHRRAVKTDRSETVRTENRAVTVPVPVSAAPPHGVMPQGPHSRVPGEAEQRPRLGGVAAAGRQGGGLWCGGARGPLPSARLLTPRPTSGHRKCQTGAPRGGCPARGFLPPPCTSFPRAVSHGQRDTNFARA